MTEPEKTQQEKNLEETLSLLQGYVNARDITKVDRLKVAVCGERGSGKSNLIARTARKPLLHYDLDDRRESIAGLEGVYIKTLVDINTTLPQAWGQIETDLGTLEYQKSKSQLPFNSIALDSMTFLRQYADNQMMKDTGANQRSASISGTKYLIPQGWDAVNYNQRMLQTLLSRFFALGIDIYCVFHTQAEKDRVKSTKETTVYTDKLTVEPQNLSILLSKFNEVWRCYLDEDSNFKLQVKPDYYFGAKTALVNIDKVENQDIQKLLEKHNSKV